MCLWSLGREVGGSTVLGPGNVGENRGLQWFVVFPLLVHGPVPRSQSPPSRFTSRRGTSRDSDGSVGH